MPRLSCGDQSAGDTDRDRRRSRRGQWLVIVGRLENIGPMSGCGGHSQGMDSPLRHTPNTSLCVVRVRCKQPLRGQERVAIGAPKYCHVVLPNALKFRACVVARDLARACASAFARRRGHQHKRERQRRQRLACLRCDCASAASMRRMLPGS